MAHSRAHSMAGTQHGGHTAWGHNMAGIQHGGRLTGQRSAHPPFPRWLFFFFSFEVFLLLLFTFFDVLLLL